MRAYEAIGSIAVISQDSDNELAKKVLENKNILTVARRTGEVKGKYRIKKVKVILGDNTTETIHKENGVKIKIDINKAYYSPRLQNERQRVMNQVKENEIIIDMFAGVGPYTIAISKNKKPKHVYAIDHNPSAIKYLKENIKINKISNITAIKGDALEKIKDLPKADRIIMNAPRQNNQETLKNAIKKLKKNGIIHYYTTSENLPVKTKLEIIKQRTVIRYAPGKTQECLDLRKK